MLRKLAKPVTGGEPAGLSLFCYIGVNTMTKKTFASFEQQIQHSRKLLPYMNLTLIYEIYFLNIYSRSNVTSVRLYPIILQKSMENHRTPIWIVQTIIRTDAIKK